MTCQTCEGPLPENDDRFLPWCSEDCMPKRAAGPLNDDSRLAAEILRMFSGNLAGMLDGKDGARRVLVDRLESGQAAVVGADYLRALEKVTAKADEHCASRGRTTIPGIADALVELDKVKP